MDLDRLLGKIAGKIGLIVPGCLRLVENNLRERWIAEDSPVYVNVFKTFNMKLMHLATRLSIKTLPHRIIFLKLPGMLKWNILSIIKWRESCSKTKCHFIWRKSLLLDVLEPAFPWYSRPVSSYRLLWIRKFSAAIFSNNLDKVYRGADWWGRLNLFGWLCRYTVLIFIQEPALLFSNEKCEAAMSELSHSNSVEEKGCVQNTHSIKKALLWVL